MPSLMSLSATVRRTGLSLLGQVDDAHAAFADLAQDAVRADALRTVSPAPLPALNVVDRWIGALVRHATSSGAGWLHPGVILCPMDPAGKENRAG